MANTYLSIKGLRIKYSETVLHNVFLDMKKGEFIAIVGKSGVGKTSLLNVLAELIRFEGTIKKPNKIGFVFQNNSLFPWMTVEENISFGLDKKNSKSIQQIIDIAGLKGKEKQYPHKLSGGQQQRVSIGRSLATKPDLLLLDEPFASLDGYTRLAMQEWINDTLDKHKITTILVTHDIDEAILLSDKILVMKNKSLENEFMVPFTRPRSTEIRYLSQFQELKKLIHNTY
ncbi:ABC transporter ATP-binding protein [Candidatus Micrarchaeota archaeon]|nr:ABC transporter ATP-binding protein [Candidatus Micrarchaeota archaeon]MBU1930666.1 ABC transporter ATP-binding protein [Candidatus Micrarchaeota archaeon]